MSSYLDSYYSYICTMEYSFISSPIALLTQLNYVTNLKQKLQLFMWYSYSLCMSVIILWSIAILIWNREQSHWRCTHPGSFTLNYSENVCRSPVENKSLCKLPSRPLPGWCERKNIPSIAGLAARIFLHHICHNLPISSLEKMQWIIDNLWLFYAVLNTQQIE